MQDTITCPACKRRLVLPPGVHDIMAQCPRCQTRFPSHPVAPEPAAAWPGVSPSPEPPARNPHPEPAPTPAPEPTPGKSWGGTSAWVVVFVVVAVGRWIFSGGAARQDRFDPVREQERNRAPGGVSKEHMDILLKTLRAEKAIDLDDLRAPDEFLPLFDALGRAFREANGERIAELYDPRRMVGEMADLELVRDQNPIAARDQVHALKKALPKLLEARAPAMAWASLEIVLIQKPEENEAVVTTRLANAGGESRSVRWRLVRRRNGRWSVYDTEEVATGKRLCTSDDLVDAAR